MKTLLIFAAALIAAAAALPAGEKRDVLIPTPTYRIGYPYAYTNALYSPLRADPYYYGYPNGYFITKRHPDVNTPALGHKSLADEFDETFAELAGY